MKQYIHAWKQQLSIIILVTFLYNSCHYHTINPKIWWFTDIKVGQKIKAGDRYGIIRFGSRADIYLPADMKIKILVGQTMIGGETVIARIGNKQRIEGHLR